MTEQDKPFTTKDITMLYNVSPKTVWEWATEGKIPAFRTIGGEFRFPRAEILALLEASRVKPEEQ